MPNEWSLGKGEWRDSNPLGKRFEDFILENCEWGIYVRKDLRFKCPEHYNQATESMEYLENPADCDLCLGFGVKVTLEIVPSRISRGRTTNIDSFDGDIKDMPGFVSNYKDVIHLPKRVHPKANDVILYCEWNKSFAHFDRPPRPRPLRIHSIYVLKEINSQHQRQLEWYSCGSKNLEIISKHYEDLLETRLVNLNVMDVSTIWPQNYYW